MSGPPGSAITYGCGFLWPGCRHHRGPDPRFCAGEVSGAVQQRLAAQSGGDAADLADGRFGGFDLTQPNEVLGVVEQAVGQVVTTPARAARPGTPAPAPNSATAPTRSSAARTARSASPSVATGVPQTAITASPMNFSTTPPYRVITVRATAKYWESSSRTASGSRASDSGVNPTTSQNSTEHTRRSATGSRPGPGAAVAASAAADGAGVTSARVAPQARQKRCPAITGAPQDGQAPTGAPQCPQNRSPCSRVAPHRPHPTPRSPRSVR
jgi:hypothetical protein